MEEDLTDKHIKEINDLVEDTYQNDEIDETIKLYLIDKTSKTAWLYLLPKIHKQLHRHQVDQWWQGLVHLLRKYLSLWIIFSTRAALRYGPL